MKKKNLCLVSLLLVVSLLVGCGVVQNPPSDTADSQEQTSTDGTTATGDTQSLPLEGADIVLKLSHTDNDISMLSNTWNCYARTFKSRLEILSGGTMTVDIYPNSQLGDETSTLEQCSKGTVDIVVGATCGNLATWVPNFNVFDIPYLIDDLEVCNLVCQGEILDELNGMLQSSGNMQVLSLMATAYRNLDTWNAPIHNVSEVKGMKVRIQSIDAHTNMVKGWGAIPASVSFSELYSAASTGVIDAFENANYTLFMNNLYETVQYITETNHLANACMCVISDKTLSSLTDEQVQWVKGAASEARKAALGVVAANDVNVMQDLQENNIEIISLTDEEKAGFKDACYDLCVDAVLQNVDEDFYQRFLTAYQEAAAYLGKA